MHYHHNPKKPKHLVFSLLFKFYLCFLDNTADLEKEINVLRWSRAEDIVVLVENLVERNCNEAMNQDDFQKKYDELDKEHGAIIDKINKLTIDIENKSSSKMPYSIYR